MRFFEMFSVREKIVEGYYGQYSNEELYQIIVNHCLNDNLEQCGILLEIENCNRILKGRSKKQLILK